MAEKFIWSYLAHLGFNMWADPEEKDGVKCFPTRKGYGCAADHLRFDKDAWYKITDELKDAGCNQIVLDLGEGVQYESHPEIAVKGSWSKNELSDELTRLKGMGFEVIPKLNFSTGHDEWMGIYSRMVSTPAYYKVCSDLIDEVCELFDRPRLFHLGMDEECFSIQETMNLCIIRHGELYWHDFFLYVKSCEKNGARPWIWADYVWHNARSRESFHKNMTKDILCSNWYYHEFKEESGWLYDSYKAYKDLEDHGFDQLPAASNCVLPENIDLTVEHGVKVIAPERLKGFMMTTWMPTVSERIQKHTDAIALLKAAKEKYENGGYTR